jgi:gas vesicle structural protein
MTVARGGGGAGTVERYTGGGGSGLGEVVEMILDKGLVVDVFARVSLLGIEIITIDIRIVIASVDTYLKFAEATNRLDLYTKGGGGLPELIEDIADGGARGKTGRVLDTAADTGGQWLVDGVASRDHEPQGAESARRRPRRARTGGQSSDAGTPARQPGEST